MRPAALPLLLALTPFSCPQRPPDPDPPAPPPAPTDPAFATRDSVWAQRCTLASRLLPSAATGSFARLTPTQREELAALVGRAGLRLPVAVAGARVLLQLPDSHPAGPLELVLAADQDLLAAYLPERKVRVAFRRASLADILDSVPESERTDFELELRPPRPTAPLPGRSIRTRAALARASLRYLPRPESTRGWPIRLRIRAVAPDELGDGEPQPLFQIGLPLLAANGGFGAIDQIGAHIGAPLGWTTTVINDARPSGAPPVLETVVEDRQLARVARLALSTARQGYVAGRTLPERRDTGRQLVAETTLERLRAGGRAAAGLRVRNRSPSSAYIHVDGALVGWVRPRRTMEFKGLPAGYYRVYAVSPTGLRAWGPHDIYIPGPLTLN
jgi:hypothetical protein